jgi:hypothetical protein
LFAPRSHHCRQIRDRGGSTTFRVSLSTGGTQGNGDSTAGAISAGSKHVAFVSAATNLVVGDTNGLEDIFVRDLP